MLAFVQFFTLQRQLILFVVSLGATVAFHFAWGWGGFAGSWFFILIMLILIGKHLVLGTINPAVMKLQTQDFEGAEKLLAYTWRPSWLKFGYHGMYYVIKSQLAFQKNEFKSAEVYSHKALAIDLPDDDAKAMVYLQLIGVYIQRTNLNPTMITGQQKTKIKALLQKAKRLHVRNEQIKGQIKELDQILKGRPNEMHRKIMSRRQKVSMNQGYMRRGGGKRR